MIKTSVAFKIACFKRIFSVLLISVLCISCSKSGISSQQHTNKIDYSVPDELIANWVGAVSDGYIFVTISKSGYKSTVYNSFSKTNEYAQLIGFIDSLGEQSGFKYQLKSDATHSFNISAMSSSSHTKAERITTDIAYYNKDGNANINTISMTFNQLNKEKNQIQLYRLGVPNKGHFFLEYKDNILQTNMRKKALMNEVSMLQANGFSCIKEAHLNVSNGVEKLNFPDGRGSNFLILSPENSGDLLYNFSSRNVYGVGLMNNSKPFPIIRTSSQGIHQPVRFSFFQKPDHLDVDVDVDLYQTQHHSIANKLPNYHVSIPVSIYQFAKNSNDNAEGCEFGKPSRLQQAFFVGKVIAAIKLEQSRKTPEDNGNIEEQLKSIYGKDFSISSTLKDVFPSANEDTLKWMTRNIGNVMQNGLDPKSFVDAATKESLVQQMEKNPQLKQYHPRFLNMLNDISFSSEVSPR